MMRQNEPLRELVRTKSKREWQEFRLVLAATRIVHRTGREGSDRMLLVRAGDYATAKAQLEKYKQENRDWPPASMPFGRPADAWPAALVYVAILGLIHAASVYGVFEQDWLRAGAADARRIVTGQWWRTVTALTLHGDMAHLLGNMFFGVLFGVFLAGMVGTGCAWLGILLSGCAANLLSAWMHKTQHVAIGASTAVFGAVGVMSGYQWLRRRTVDARGLRAWLPLLGGAGLLAFLGVSGKRADLMGHLAGYGMGCVIGIVYACLRMDRRWPEKADGVLLFCVPLAVVLCWIMALYPSHPAL